MNFLCRRVKDAKNIVKNKRKRSSKQKQILRRAPHAPLPSRLPGPRPVTYKHTSVRLKIALLQLDYKNARQKY